MASFEVYGNITQLFLDQKYEELSAFVTGHKDVLDKNNDYGLALQTCEHLLKVKIISLSKIYSAIRLSDLVAKVGVDPYKVEQILVSLILSGRIESSIDRPAGIAYFGSEQNPQKSDELIEEERMKLLEHQMQQSMLLSTHLKELQKNLYSSPRYILSNDKEFLTAIKSSSGADSLMDFH